MSVRNEVCGSESNKTKNVGGKLQCLESPVKTKHLAREGFAFDSIADAKNKAKWDEAIANKDIIPFPDIEGIEANNTEASIRNGRFKDYTLKEAVRGSRYRLDLAVCTHEAVKSYEDSDYTRVFRVTSEEQFTCEITEDGKVKGESLTSYIVGIRNEATDDDVPFTNVDLKYKREVFDILQSPFPLSEMEGILDVSLEQVSASSTEIKFKANKGCGGNAVTVFEEADVEVKDASGEVQAVTFTTADPNGVYTITTNVTSPFENGFTIGLVGVVSKTEAKYESPEVLTVSGIA